MKKFGKNWIKREKKVRKKGKETLFMPKHQLKPTKHFDLFGFYWFFYKKPDQKKNRLIFSGLVAFECGYFVCLF